MLSLSVMAAARERDGAATISRNVLYAIQRLAGALSQWGQMVVESLPDLQLHLPTSGHSERCG